MMAVSLADEKVEWLVGKSVDCLVGEMVGTLVDLSDILKVWKLAVGMVGR